MFRVQSLFVVLGLVLCILPLRRAMAQQSSESDVVYEAARNKIGLIRYCRKKGLLTPAVADEVVAAVEGGLHKLVPGHAFASRGDRAEQAGEDGFWNAGRTRDVDSVAKLFHTTPADLCQEWADETLRAQPPKPYQEVTTITLPSPYRPRLPAQQSEPSPAEPVEEVGLPAIATVAGDIRSAPLPPMPEKAPFLPAGAEPAALQRSLPTVPRQPSAERAALGQTRDTAPAVTSTRPPSWGRTVPLSARIEAAAETDEAEAPLPREQDLDEEALAPDIDDRPPSFWNRWPFNGERPQKSQRCLMPGCKWPSASPERRSSQY